MPSAREPATGPMHANALGRRQLLGELVPASLILWAGGCATRTRRPSLPPALPIDPPLPLAVFAEKPTKVHAELRGWFPNLPGPVLSIQRLLLSRNIIDAGWLKKLLGHVDPHRSFAALELAGGQQAVVLSLRSDRFAKAEAQVKALPVRAAAHELPRPPRATHGDPWLGWLDTEAKQVILASGLRAIASGRAYIGQQVQTGGLQLQADRPQWPLVGLQLAHARGLAGCQRLELAGSIARPRVRALFADGAPRPLDHLALEPGNLGHLLGDPGHVWGLSCRSARLRKAAETVLAQLKRRSGGGNFIVKSIVEGHMKRLSTAVRSFDGRVAVACATRSRLRLALGCHDLNKAGGALAQLLQELSSQLALARKFTKGLPRVDYRKASSSVGDIHRVMLAKAKNYIPREFWPLIDEKGQLRAALHFHRTSRSVMLCIGPRAPNELEAWLKKMRPAGAPTSLVSAVARIEPAQVLALAERAPTFGLRDLVGLLQLRAGPRAHTAALTAISGGYELELTSSPATV